MKKRNLISQFLLRLKITYKPGFVTSEDLKNIGLPGKVSVYLPHSYNFSGNVFISDKKNITPLSNPSSEVMKYIVSGGISGKIKV